jgi:peptidoglycan/LPS O-acetylase OafA/YrhL
VAAGSVTEGERRVGLGQDAGRTSPSAAVVPDAVAPPPRHRRFPLFDGLRAIAVFSVVLLHVTLFSDGLNPSVTGHLLARLNVGVTIFFLISGFLLYRPFIAHRVGGASPPEVLAYAKRRVLRIYPAYWLVLTVLLIIPGIGGAPNAGVPAEYGLVHVLPFHGGPGCVQECGLTQTWSLVVELTFYAALPLYVVAAARLARGRSVRSWMRAELLLLGALAAISLAARFFWIDGSNEWMNGSVVGYAYWFALGMGLAVVSVGLEGRERQPRLVALIVDRPLIPWAAALAAYVVLSLLLPVVLATTADRLAVMIGFGAIAALLLLPAVFGDDAGGAPRRVLANPVVAWLGLISYGIFLWHYVFAQQLGRYGADGGFFDVLIGTVALSVACAAISYYLVERPVLRFKYKRLMDAIPLRRPKPPSVPAPDVTQPGRL